MKIIKLKQPVEGHTVIHELHFREPKMADLMEFGEWRTIAFTEEGKPYLLEKDYVLKAYIEKCIIKPADWLSIEQELSYEDGLQVKEFFVGFFLRGGRMSEDITT